MLDTAVVVVLLWRLAVEREVGMQAPAVTAAAVEEYG
jgi:hypothetical protein